jgi:hypothetical protein
MQDFRRDFFEKNFPRLSPEEQQEMLQSLSPEAQSALLRSLPPEERPAGLSPEEIHQYLERLTAEQTERRKPHRKK